MSKSKMSRYKKGSCVYWLNEHGEHIPGLVLEVKRRVKVHLNDLTGDRSIWTETSRIIPQEPTEDAWAGIPITAG